MWVSKPGMGPSTF